MKTICFVLTTIFILAAGAFAQGAIDGSVLNAKTAVGVANITVNIVGSDGKVVATVTTDGSGAFTVEDLDAGTYKISVRDAKGFQPTDLGNIEVLDDETATVLLKLSAVVAVTPQGGGNTQTGGLPQPTPTATAGCTARSASISKQYSTVNVNWVNNFDGSDRQTGTVKWFNDCKGFGFITLETGQDLFVQFRSVLGSGFRSLKEGQKVTFKVVTGRNGLHADAVQIL